MFPAAIGVCLLASVWRSASGRDDKPDYLGGSIGFRLVRDAGQGEGAAHEDHKEREHGLREGAG